MENVEITETRGGNPKYCLLDIPLEIVVRKDGKNSYTVHMQSKKLSYNEITGRNIKNDRHAIYITSVHKEAYHSFSESLINQVRSLSSRNVQLMDIVKEIYYQYHNEEKTKTEIFDLQEEFIEVKKDFDNLKVKMDNICKKIELL